MIPSLVFSVWISTLSLSALEAELVLEEDANPQLEPSTEFQRKMQFNGSRENTMVLSTTDLYLNDIRQSYLLEKQLILWKFLTKLKKRFKIEYNKEFK
jgi:hypothetical protein